MYRFFRRSESKTKHRPKNVAVEYKFLNTGNIKRREGEKIFLHLHSIILRTLNCMEHVVSPFVSLHDQAIATGRLNVTQSNMASM